MANIVNKIMYHKNKLKSLANTFSRGSDIRTMKMTLL